MGVATESQSTPGDRMSYVLSLITNDVQMLPRTLEYAAPMVSTVAQVKRGWGGVGTYQDGRAVVRRARISEGLPPFGDALNGQTTNRMLCHVQDQPESTYSPENAQPFRYKNWLFALAGTLGGGDLNRDKALALIPDYLRSNIQGTLPPELVFHIFLAALHDEARLPVQRREPARIARALDKTLEVLPGLAEGEGEIGFSLVLSNEEQIYGATHGRQLFYRQVDGIEVPASGGRTEKLDWVRALFLCNYIPQGEEALWQSLSQDQLIHCDEAFRVGEMAL